MDIGKSARRSIRLQPPGYDGRTNVRNNVEFTSKTNKSIDVRGSTESSEIQTDTGIIVRKSVDTGKAGSTRFQLDEEPGVFEISNHLEAQSKRTTKSTPENAAAEEEQPVQATVAEVKQKEPQRFSQVVKRTRASTWWLMGAILIVPPLVVTATAYSDRNMDGIRVSGFLIWLEVLWTAAWLMYFIAWALGKIWYQVCEKAHLNSYKSFLLESQTSINAFFLAIIAYCTVDIMCYNESDSCGVHWIEIFRTVLLATLPASAVFLAKDLLMQLIITRSQTRLKRSRLKKVLRHFQAHLLLVEDRANTSRSTWAKLTDYFGEKYQKLRKANILLRSKPPSPHDFDNLADRYWNGKGKDEDFDTDGVTFLRALRKQLEASFTAWFQAKLKLETIELSQTIFTKESIQKMLDTPPLDKMNTFEYLGNRPFMAKEIIEILDKDGNQEASLQEWVDVDLEIRMSLRDINKSLDGIKKTAKSVNIVVSGLMLVIMAIIYAAFFTNNLGNYLTPIWTTITGLSFALADTVTEFVQSCSFVFSKQPYDVGDHVIIEAKELIVDEIFLLYTVFHRTCDGVTEQIAHIKIVDVWISNLSRSKGLVLKETVNLPDFASKLSYETLADVKKKLDKYIKEVVPCSRYLKANVKLRMLGDSMNRQVEMDLQCKELLVRREHVLAQSREMAREKLKELIHASLNPDDDKSVRTTKSSPAELENEEKEQHVDTFNVPKRGLQKGSMRAIALG
ncbi:hypothetical protein M501DRAFT_1016471 [Patellaria atrata CBS 101060]|uniref:Mechanosensitive ion channel protein Msy1/2-like transmembrane domain-containing protein n=1 Tax=Patellaria atrata CBS 101060 TaxID=1346257 RepID=A0A9P4SD23_9PEZI|nr:hypothetical protein M501DRAFT_1016471 [Patellaria atrata CBS 101060]